MSVPSSEVGYTAAMPRREDHEVHKRTCGGIGGGELWTIVFGGELETMDNALMQMFSRIWYCKKASCIH